MEDLNEVTLKNVCCTCLSTERKLSQLCRVLNGVNNLFFLLSYNCEAYEAIFTTDVTQLYICWECMALMRRLTKFREQACAAQAALTDISDGKVTYSKIKCLSKLSHSHQNGYKQELTMKVEMPENFVDCGPNIDDVKIENYDSPSALLTDFKNNKFEKDNKNGVKTIQNHMSCKNKDVNSLIVETPIRNSEINDNYSTDKVEINFNKTKANNIMKDNEILVSENEHSSENEISDNNYSALENYDVKIQTKKIKVKNKTTPPSNKDNIKPDFSTSDTADEDSLNYDDSTDVKILKKRKRKDSASYYVNIPIANADIVDYNSEMETSNSIENLDTLKNPKAKVEKCFHIIKMNDEDRLESVNKRKLDKLYVNAFNKCESCMEIFDNCDILEKHISDLHTPKPNHVACNICQVYVKYEYLDEHNTDHYYKYGCLICKKLYYNTQSLQKHWKEKHLMQESFIMEQIKCINEVKMKRKDKTKASTSDIKKLKILLDDPKGPGFACDFCNKYFKSRNLRQLHVQKQHGEGYQCTVCGKRFPHSASLRRHETIHCNPPPRQQCAVCGRMVRADCVRAHARYHGERGRFECVACDKKFVSQGAYKSHLKYSRGHANRDPLKHKCGTCGKDYRSPGELRDHINYNHMGKTVHKCPICDKALATRRSVTRHIRRQHHGVKENARDKICQTCGKGFTCTKSLREHELRHTGERPLSCDICSRTFRQQACLYTHKRRVHKIALKRKPIHTEEIVVLNTEINKKIE